MAGSRSKVMMITGGASGIGASLARQAAAAGYQVVIADIDDGRARDVAHGIGKTARAVRLDICSSDQWEAVLDEVWRLYGGLDILVNNAAVVHTGYAREVPIWAHQQVMDTNFMGPVRGMLAALPRFKAQGRGHLVTICSMTGFLPFPGLASYAAAKHALRAFHHALVLEERTSPVKFTIIHPTATETPMLEKEAEDDALALAFAGQSMSADAAAEIILAAIEKKAVEVFIPPERGKVVKRVGTSPRSLRKLIERNEVIGAQRLAERRAKAAGREQ